MAAPAKTSLPINAPRVTEAELELSRQLRNASIPDIDLAQNGALFMSPRTLKRVMFLDEIYQAALPVHGVIMQFGVRWGRDIAVFDSLRTIYEPFNISRTVIGFDTFEGFPSVHAKDGEDPVMVPGSYSTKPGYDQELAKTLSLRQQLDPLPDLRRAEICKGDAVEQLAAYLERHPETIVALAYFDLDIYEPTKGCLELLKPYLTKGSVMAFDELNFFKAPGETLALKEVFPLDSIRIRRSVRYSGQPAFFTIE